MGDLTLCLQHCRIEAPVPVDGIFIPTEARGHRLCWVQGEEDGCIVVAAGAPRYLTSSQHDDRTCKHHFKSQATPGLECHLLQCRFALSWPADSIQACSKQAQTAKMLPQFMSSQLIST